MKLSLAPLGTACRRLSFQSACCPELLLIRQRFKIRWHSQGPSISEWLVAISSSPSFLHALVSLLRPALSSFLYCSTQRIRISLTRACTKTSASSISNRAFQWYASWEIWDNWSSNFFGSWPSSPAETWMVRMPHSVERDEHIPRRVAVSDAPTVPMDVSNLDVVNAWPELTCSPEMD